MINTVGNRALLVLNETLAIALKEISLSYESLASQHVPSTSLYMLAKTLDADDGFLVPHWPHVIVLEDEEIDELKDLLTYSLSTLTDEDLRECCQELLHQLEE